MDIWLERPFAYKRPWTSEEEELIQSGRHLGYTYKRIAESLEGRTPNAIRHHWHFMNKKQQEVF